MGNGQRFQVERGRVEAAATAFLLEWFGERCPDFEPHCEVCKRWAALDTLLEDPFIESRSQG